MKRNLSEPWRKREGNQEHLRVPPSTTFFVISSRKMTRNSRLLSVRVFGLPVPIIVKKKRRRIKRLTKRRKIKVDRSIFPFARRFTSATIPRLFHPVLKKFTISRWTRANFFQGEEFLLCSPPVESTISVAITFFRAEWNRKK